MPTDATTTDIARFDVSAWSPIHPAASSLVSCDDGTLVRSATALAAELPAALDLALSDFVDRPSRCGAMLLSGLPIGDLPDTPPAPDSPVDKDHWTERLLLAIARRLGQPVGYAPEHGGRIVQNIVPTQTAADSQMSTSSRSNLMFHTETAFHPHRPRHLALLCLRGDPAARTTLASIFDIVDELRASGQDDTIDRLFEPRFRTSVDASFLGGRIDQLGPTHPILTGTLDEPTFVFDADLTVGIDDASESATAALREAIATVTTGVVLEPGDLLLIDNNLAVHGRSPFSARFDGTDRWLQRAFIVSDLAPSAADRVGRVITTTFGRPA